MISHATIDFIGAFAGTFAISIALYLQMIKEHLYAGAYIAALYILGVFMLLLNLEPILVGTGYWRFARLFLYLTVITVEVGLLYDLKDGRPRIIRKLRKIKKRNGWDEDNQEK